MAKQQAFVDEPVTVVSTLKTKIHDRCNVNLPNDLRPPRLGLKAVQCLRDKHTTGKHRGERFLGGGTVLVWEWQ